MERFVGTNEMPASKGPNPRSLCSRWVVKNRVLSIPAPTTNMTAHATSLLTSVR